MGLTRVASGPLALDRVDLGARPPHLRARLGIGYVSEGRRLISALSAREDIRVPAWLRVSPTSRRGSTPQHPDAEARGARVEAAVMPSGGQKVAICTL